MKILILTDKMDIGGAETHVFTLISELVKTNTKVTLICAGGTYADFLKNQGVNIIFAPLDKRNPNSVKKSIKILKSEFSKHDIVHAHTRFTAFLSAGVRGNRKYPAIVTTAHLNFPIFPYGPLAYWGDSTLAVSDDIENYLIKNYRISKKNIIKTKNSIDTSLFTPAEHRKPVIVHTSRIDTGRSATAFILVKSAKKILAIHPEYRILIVGNGNKYDKLKELAEKANAELGFNAIALTGARGDISEIIRHGAIFIGVSRAALEGMAAELPTIICGDEGYGGIVTEENFDALASTNFCARGLPKPTEDKLIKDIKFLIDNPGYGTHMGKYLRSRIRKDYSPLSMRDDAIRCYSNAHTGQRVLLVGFFGYNNLGDEEALNCAIRALTRAGVSDIAILSAKNYINLQEAANIKIYDRMNITKIAEAINSSDSLILCGGNLLQNETSTKSLLYYSKIISFAKKRGRRIYMLSSGFGEIKGLLGKELLQQSIKSCDFCGCRTSYDYNLASLYTSNAMIMPDLCFLLPEYHLKVDKTSFAWIVTRHTKISFTEIRHIEKMRGLKPLIIILYKSEDSEIAKKAKDEGFKVLTAHSFEKFASVISPCSFSICERLHGAIFSLLCHIPSYISDESCKNRALLSEIRKRNKGRDIMLPYRIADVSGKKEIGAQDSDFKYVINDLKCDIYAAFKELF